jgi:nanoRNase/pAp phosphatase (c-di-AMP/oligoRNAs hydrolase)
MICKNLASLDKNKPVLILIHNNPDPDAIASAWGISYLLKKNIGLDAFIAYSGFIGRAENRALVKVLKIPLKKVTARLWQQEHTIILADCQPYTGNNPLPEDVVPDIIIDHHPLRETTKYKQWATIDENLGSTSTIITACIKESGLAIPKPLATALFYAIRSETKDLGWERTRLDHKHYLDLLPQVDFDALYQIEHPTLSPDYFRMVKTALDRSRVYRHVVVCPLDEVPYPELPAEIADFLIFREGTTISFVMGRFGNDMYLSLRSVQRGTNSAVTIRKVLGKMGTGGGHEIMAGGKIPDLPQYKLRDVEKTLIKRLLKEFQLSRVKENKLF